MFTPFSDYITASEVAKFVYNNNNKKIVTKFQMTNCNEKHICFYAIDAYSNMQIYNLKICIHN